MRAAHRWEVLAEMAAAVRREAKVVLEAKVVRMEIYFPHCQGSMEAMTGMEGQDLDSAFRLEMGPLQVLVALLAQEHSKTHSEQAAAVAATLEVVEVLLWALSKMWAVAAQAAACGWACKAPHPTHQSVFLL